MFDENSGESGENGVFKGLKRKHDEMRFPSEDLLNDNDHETVTDENTTHEHSEKKLSKGQLRKIKKKEKWLAYRPEKRAKEREKLKARRMEAKLNNIDLGPSRKLLKNKTMANSNCKIHVAVDMSFDDYMVDKDLSKCLKQLLRCYTLNRRADNPLQLYFTSFSGKCKTYMEKNNGYTNWDVNFREDYVTEVFPKEKLVYLSSDSPNTILALEEDKVYVIGGLVDHNVHKGLCHKIAEENGISHAQLPIGEFLKMSSRKVLTIDHVFEILLNVTRCLSWEEALLNVLPKRKGALPKGKSGESDTEDGDNRKSDQSDPTQLESGMKSECVGPAADATKSKSDSMQSKSSDVKVEVPAADATKSKSDPVQSKSSDVKVEVPGSEPGTEF